MQDIIRNTLQKKPTEIVKKKFFIGSKINSNFILYNAILNLDSESSVENSNDFLLKSSEDAKVTSWLDSSFLHYPTTY